MMYTVTVGDRDVFQTDNAGFARSVFREWTRHSTNPTSMAYEICIMLFGPSGSMLETSVTDGLDYSV
jgi:hypothetical protein